MANVDRNVGYGIIYPLQLVGDDFDAGGGSPLFRSRIDKVLGVQSAAPDGSSNGEYPWRGNFGSQVSKLRHANYGALFPDVAQVFAINSIYEWEPLAAANLAETTLEAEGVGHKARLKISFSRFEDQTGNVVDAQTVETDL